MQHILVATVENRPGVLNRVASLFRRRNFNIASLTVGVSEDPTVSRMTIVVDTKTTRPHIVIENLYKMVEVIDVQDLTAQNSVVRDLALVKVQTGTTTRREIMQFAELYRARIVQVARETLVLEMTGEPREVDAFIEIMQGFGLIEMVRTGVVAMATGARQSEQADAASSNGQVSHYIQPLAEREGV